jgi:hypothetical protein
MSRGPGTIQRIIIDAVTNGIGGTFPDARFLPLLVIADNAGYDTTKLAVRQSFARAARALDGSGTIALWYLPVSETGLSVISRTRIHRDMVCVGPAGYEPSDGPRGFVSGHTDVENAEMMCWELFESVTDPFRTMRRQMVTPADA